ncbi:MAG: hypothetical protein AAF616_04130 [Bacteroidota bacterium]
MNNKEIDINLNISVDISEQAKNGKSFVAHEHLEKIEIDMSVAQIAYLFRMLYDLNYITNKNQTDILKVVASYFRTVNAEDISLKSLKAKYYSIDNATKQSLKNRLIEMLNHINKK